MTSTASAIDAVLVRQWMGAGAPVILITISDVSGSAPRGTGATMAVSGAGKTGTIGGGALEWALIATAREMLASGETLRNMRQPLGPEIGQCCGGMVKAELRRLTDADPAPQKDDTSSAVYIFGAGHVGAALARALAALPVRLTVVDQRGDLLAPLAQFGEVVETVLPEATVAAAPSGVAFVVTTHDHALDFLIVEAALRRGDARYVGMIGSASKRAVLAKRLATAGLSDAALTCPIGAGVSTDKRPEIIAATTAAELAGALF